MIVLKLGASGGSLTLYRITGSEGDLYFEVSTDETTLQDLLSPIDEIEPHEAVTHTLVASFEEAITLLDKYPWTKLYPLQMHSEYRDAILLAVAQRSGEGQARRWRSILVRCKPL